MNYIIIPAAGKSTRFGEDKLGLKIHGKTILEHTIEKFEGLGEVIVIKKGGETRQESVYKGLLQAKKMGAQKNDIIVIHNAANPLVTVREIKKCICEAKKYGACAVAHFMMDTIKEIDDEKKVKKTLNRDKLVAMQTPQVIEFDLFWQAHQKAKKDRFNTTDDVALVENIGHPVKIIPASPQNFKITTREDFEKIKMFLGDMTRGFRSGIGHDSHRFSDAGELILGGLKISGHKKLEANSDGDVILHAICNAIAQSIGEKSLGSFADSLCKEGQKDSSVYLRKILEKVNTKGFKIHYCGISVEGRSPRIDPVSEKIKKNLTKLLGISKNQIGITATSGENLTAFGRGEGVQCFANITLREAQNLK